jgi:hypothetical protein
VKKKILAVVSASLSLMLATVVVTSAMASKDPFIGRWHSIDAFDGSHQTMNIGGADGHFRVTLYDDGASVCGVDESDQPIYAAFVTGLLSENEAGDTLSGDVNVRCMSTPPSVQGPYAVEFDYVSGNDTLQDGFGTTWYRWQVPIP